MKYIFTFYIFLFTQQLSSQSIFDHDPDKLDFSLITVGLGDELYTRFGHNALRMKHQDGLFDLSFNWGLFDFDFYFPVRFFRGILIYKLGVYEFKDDLERYQETKRWMIEDAMRLSRADKIKLIEKLKWNLKPENRAYPYQYFFDNCSTRIRDFMDDILGGQVKKKYAEEDSQKTFRDYVRRNLTYSPFVILSLDVLMNGDIDRHISHWEEMFLPEKLREYLSKLSVEGQSFLYNTKNYVQSEDDFGGNHDGHFYVGIIFIILNIWIIIRNLKWRRSPVMPNDRRESLGIFIEEKILLLFSGFFNGIYGFVMIISWFLSAHTDLHHNWNLLAFWPIDFILIIFAFRFPDYIKRYEALLKIYLIGHIILATLHLAGSYLHFWQQDTQVIALNYALNNLWMFSYFYSKMNRLKGVKVP